MVVLYRLADAVWRFGLGILPTGQVIYQQTGIRLPCPLCDALAMDGRSDGSRCVMGLGVPFSEPISGYPSNHQSEADMCKMQVMIKAKQL